MGFAGHKTSLSFSFHLCKKFRDGTRRRAVQTKQPLGGLGGGGVLEPFPHLLCAQTPAVTMLGGLETDRQPQSGPHADFRFRWEGLQGCESRACRGWVLATPSPCRGPGRRDSGGGWLWSAWSSSSGSAAGVGPLPQDWGQPQLYSSWDGTVSVAPPSLPLPPSTSLPSLSSPSLHLPTPSSP